MFGVHTKAAITATKTRGTKLGGNRGVKPTVKMRIQSAAGRQRVLACVTDFREGSGAVVVRTLIYVKTSNDQRRNSVGALLEHESRTIPVP